MIITHSLAMAVGRDAGNASMKAHGRKVWNKKDYEVAASQTAKLLSLIKTKDVA